MPTCIHAYILVKGRITIAVAGDSNEARQAYERNKGVILKNCAPFTNCKITGSTPVDGNIKDVEMAVLLKY